MKLRNLYRYLLIVALVTVLPACRQKLPEKAAVITAMQNLQNLATVEYTVTKVVKANDNLEWYKPGDRKILITCEATLKAGIDLAEITAENISISGKSISMTLPPPKLLSINLPPEKIKVAYSEVGFFRSDFTNGEKNALLAQAEKQIWYAGENMGILQQAKLNTQSFLNSFLLQLGFENIELSFSGMKDSKAVPPPLN